MPSAIMPSVTAPLILNKTVGFGFLQNLVQAIMQLLQTTFLIFKQILTKTE
jgi:hypothetical protein